MTKHLAAYGNPRLSGIGSDCRAYFTSLVDQGILGEPDPNTANCESMVLTTEEGGSFNHMYGKDSKLLKKAKGFLETCGEISLYLVRSKILDEGKLEKLLPPMNKRFSGQREMHFEVYDRAEE